MDDAMIATQFENLDRRLARVEQILPTLATKEALWLAVEPLATREALRLAVEPLATRKELKALEVTLRQEIREASKESRHHMDLIAEALHDDIRLLAEHLTVVMSRLDGL